jgi:hypothetical protein
VECDPQRTAVVFIYPHNDLLSHVGKNWAAVGASVTDVAKGWLAPEGCAPTRSEGSVK